MTSDQPKKRKKKLNLYLEETTHHQNLVGPWELYDGCVGNIKVQWRHLVDIDEKVDFYDTRPDRKKATVKE